MPDNDLPRRMLRQGRPVDPAFTDDEQLYRRCLQYMVLEGRLLPESFGDQPPAIDSPSTSVNREKYGEPEDVLRANTNDPERMRWGIAQFQRGDVPMNVPDDAWEGESSYTWTFGVEHVPEDQNYAHSEVRTYRDGEFDERRKVARTVKKYLRQVLSDASVIIREPQK